MNQEYITINRFERNKELESRIDRIIVLQYFQAQSIKLYLDIMDELIDEYDKAKDRYSIGRLSRYIRQSTLNPSRYTNQRFLQYDNYLNNSEIDYLRSLDEYLTGLRSIFLGVKFTIEGLHGYLQSVVKKYGQSPHLDFEILREQVVKYINEFNFSPYRATVIEGNLYIYLHNRSSCIALVGNSKKFQLVDHRWHVSIIVLDSAPLLLSKIKEAYNITFMDYIDDRGNFNRVNIKNPLDWCFRMLHKIIKNVERVEGSQDVVTRLSKVMIELRKLEDCCQSYPIGLNDLDIKDIKFQRLKLKAIDDDLLEGFDSNRIVKFDLCKLISFLGLLCNTLQNYFNLDSSISFALSEIKKSNTLYIVSKNLKKSEKISFGEENLSAILASNLRCLLHKQKNISVNCESMVGNGRSDVRLNLGNETIGIIESKLINKGKNVEEETRNALDQLYSRYSENESAGSHRDVKLYLVIFSYDKKFIAMAQSIKNAVYEYAERNALDYKKVDKSENGITFVYNEPRSHLGLLDKERTIKIMVCNMEIDYQSRSKQRTQKKSYTS